MAGAGLSVAIVLSVCLACVVSQPTIDINMENMNNEFNRLHSSLQREHERVERLENLLASKSSSELRTETACDPFASSKNRSSVSVRLLKRLSTASEDAFRGVAVGRNEIYVMGYLSRRIRVYEDTADFRHLRDIFINDVIYPYDLVYSNKSDCLYIADYTDKCIWKLVTSNGSSNLTRWLNNISPPCTMSLTRDGNVLLTYNMQGSSSPNRLAIYDSNAETILSLKLPVVNGTPQHAVQTPWGTFIVSYKVQDKEKGFLIQITNEGAIVNRFDSKIKWDDMGWVPFICLDSKRELLLAAEIWMHRVLVFDARSLALLQTLTSTGDSVSDRPFRLVLDEGSRRLLSGQWATKKVGDSWMEGKVDVYQLS